MANDRNKRRGRKGNLAASGAAPLPDDGPDEVAGPDDRTEPGAPNPMGNPARDASAMPADGAAATSAPSGSAVPEGVGQSDEPTRRFAMPAGTPSTPSTPPLAAVPPPPPAPTPAPPRKAEG